MYRLVQIQFRKQDNSWRVSMNDDVGKSRLILFSRATKSDNKNGQIADRNTYPVENDPPESVG